MADEKDDKDKGGGAGDDKSKSTKDSAAGADDKGGKGSGAGEKGKSAAGKTYSEEEHQAAIEAAIAEDRQSRRRADTSKAIKTTKAKKDGEAEDSEELVKERQRREQLEEKLRIRDAQDSVVAAAKAAGFKSPEKIYRLVKDDLTFDNDGKPDNVKDLITLAKRDYAEELEKKGNGSADGGAGSRSDTANGNMNDFIRRAAGRRV